MELPEILDGLKIKIKETDKLTGLNSRHFGFKNWHNTTLSLLRNLPSAYSNEINDFKRLSFEDTGFHRGNRFFTQTDNTKYREDLGTAADVLEKIVSIKKSEKPKISTVKTSKADAPEETAQTPPVKKPAVKKQGGPVTASVKKAKKPKTSDSVRSPAKTGKASGRKKKPLKE